MVKTAFNKQNEAGVCGPDHRGRQQSANKLEEERLVIKEYIKSFCRVPSHCCRKETVGKEFLESQMTIEQKCNLYKQSREKTGAKPATYWVDRDVLRTVQYIRSHRNKDQCATCMSYTNEEEKSQNQEEYDRHIREKKLVAVINEEQLEKLLIHRLFVGLEKEL